MNETNLPRKLKLPSHVMEFHCAQCGECCTNKWKIEVDTVSYDKLYKKFEQLGRQQELYDNISHHNVSPRIRFLKNGKCPYLSSNNQCTIQLNIGAEYLLDICKVYPRRIFASQHALDFSLSLTCRTAVKTLQQGPIRNIEIAWPIDDAQNIPFSFIEPNNFIQYCPDNYLIGNLQLPYYVIEDRFIEILQNRQYSVSQRLVFLGQVLKGLISGHELKNSQDVAQRFQSILNYNQFITAEPDLKRHLDHLFFISNIFQLRSSSVVWSQHLKNILLALASDKPHHTEPTNEIARFKIMPPHHNDYRRKLEQYYQPAFGLVEPILENYMVNYVLGKHFYSEPLHLAYYRMAFAYAAITALTIGYSILTSQPVSQQIMLEAIFDVENIFYSLWFYPRAANFQAGQSHLHIIENGIALANLWPTY